MRVLTCLCCAMVLASKMRMMPRTMSAGEAGQDKEGRGQGRPVLRTV